MEFITNERIIQTSTFSYDAENHLTGVTGPVAASFVYDGDGRRVKATVNGVTTAYPGRHFEWSGSTSSMKTYYEVQGQRIAVRERSGAGTAGLTFLLNDHLGSTNASYQAQGGAVSALRYTPWGETRYASGATPTTYRFTGQRAEMELGIYDYNARWLDPALGRFLQADTLVPDPYNPMDWNRYTYVRSNPIIYTDPTGHIAQPYLFYDADVGQEGLSPFPVTSERIATVIEDQFGIEMKEDGEKWSLTNLYTAFNALSMINTSLNGHLQSMLYGTSFVLSSGGNQYYGRTYNDKVVYHVFNSNIRIPLTNFLHETGHLLDWVPATANVFSGPLNGTTPVWIDAKGYVDANLLLGKLHQPVQAKYITGEDFDTDEYWADAFANFVAGNINLSNPIGKQMHNYVFGALYPYANP